MGIFEVIREKLFGSPKSSTYSSITVQSSEKVKMIENKNVLSEKSEKLVENVKIDSQNSFDENLIKREICESMRQKLPEILTQTLSNAEMKMDHKIEVDDEISEKIPSNEKMTKIDSFEDNILVLEEKIRPITEYFTAAKISKEYDLRPRD